MSGDSSSSALDGSGRNSAEQSVASSGEKYEKSPISDSAASSTPADAQRRWDRSAGNRARSSSVRMPMHAASRARARGDMRHRQLPNDEQRGCAETVDEKRDEPCRSTTVSPRMSHVSGRLADELGSSERVVELEREDEADCERDQQHGEHCGHTAHQRRQLSPPARPSSHRQRRRPALRGTARRRRSAGSDRRRAPCRRPARISPGVRAGARSTGAGVPACARRGSRRASVPPPDIPR